MSAIIKGNTSKSVSAFKFALLTIALIVLLNSIAFIIPDFSSNLSTLHKIVIGLLIVIFSGIGVVKNIKGRKEPHTIKKYMGFTVNALVVLLFVYGVISTLISTMGNL